MLARRGQKTLAQALVRFYGRLEMTVKQPEGITSGVRIWTAVSGYGHPITTFCVFKRQIRKRAWQLVCT
jgi:hypothetical protein